MKQKLTFTYGTETRDLEIDPELLAAPPVAPRARTGEPRPAREVLVEALIDPLGRPPLREMVVGKKVAMIISDEFRAGLHETILDVMLEEIAAGGPTKVTVLCGTGTHDPAIYTPKIREWTEAAAAKHKLEVDFVAHDCDDPKLVEIGTTERGTKVILEPSWLEADVRVSAHEAKHHYMAGYSTVIKHVLPAISGRASVTNNHRLALDDDSQAGQYPLHPDYTRRRNPFSQDALEAFRMSLAHSVEPDGTVVEKKGESFLIDMISDKDEVFYTRAGDPEQVTPQICAAADRQAEFKVPASQYVVVSPGGPPASTALYGVQNCFDMALLGAIKKNGEALVLGPCDGRPGMDEDVKGLAPDAKSKALFWDNLVRLKKTPLEEAHHEIHDNFQLYLWKTWRVLRLFKRDGIKIWMHCELSPEVLAKGGFEHCADPQAWIDERVARADGKFIAIDGGNKLLVRPE
jgi:nickel-dependent lactate racemase